MGMAKTVTATEKPYLTLDDLAVAGRIALVRGDLNVPTERDAAGNWQVTDKTRLVRLAPTLRELADQGARVVVLSHFGRPKGGADLENSLRPVAPLLAQILGRPVHFAEDCVGEKAAAAIAAAEEGAVVLLENVRFHAGEEKNDAGFARSLAALGDLYVNDAFSAAHRAHASTVGITKFIPASAAGFLLKKEIEYLEGAVENPVRPFVAILGGAKVSGKIGVIENLGKRVDKVIIGGGMAFTFLKAKGLEIGNSLVEMDMLDFARGIEEHAFSRGVKFYLPVDCVVAASREPGAETKIVPVQEIPKGWYGLDIGPASTKLFSEALQDAKTILWNGPMGMFEVDAFARGTLSVAHAVANAYALTIVGGGETALAVHRAGESDSISFISTGGGAALELLEGKQLPGLAALPDRV